MAGEEILLGAFWPGRARTALDDDVRAPQRSRILAAMVEAVADKGYLAVSVSDVTSRARVSRATFYEQFADKPACFLAAVEACALRLAAALEEAVPTDLPPRRRLDLFLARALETVAAAPDVARVCLVESYAAGPPAMALRRDLHGLAAARLRVFHEALAAAGEPVRPVTDVELEALAGALTTLVTHRVVDDAPSSLLALHAPMRTIVLTHFGLPE
jgi:AcrR family transcriptional regulator